MAVSICCQAHNPQLVGRISPSSSVESSTPIFSPSAALSSRENSSSSCTTSIALKSEEKPVDNVVSAGFGRWATLACAAAASISVLTAAPAVMAEEHSVSNGGMITSSTTGDLSLSIAIPIPDADTWKQSQSGFLAPPPRAGGEVVVVSNFSGGCPAWSPSQFETIVPDGVHRKSFPRHGGVWYALYEQDEATIEYPAMNSTDPSVKYTGLVDALLRLEADMECFSL